MKQILKKFFGFDTFLPLQEDIIKHTMNGGDSLVLMPTGGGKSLCFQMSALMMEGMAVIVSPLISLMKDQVENLRLNGIAAEALNSSNDEDHNRYIINRCVEGKVKLLYISPERLVGSTVRILQKIRICLFAIDEAHCISNWGHDFRPEYTQLGQLKQLFPNVPIMALTATADKITKEDILVQLYIKGAKTFISSFDRPNLSLDVKRGLSAREKFRSIQELILRHPNESGIIYCLARKTTEKLAEKLKKAGISVGVYHAGLPNLDRNQIQDDFINDRIQVICATIAFGMGIDKSNVRFVVHYNLPKSIESFYQEIGRGGRDGLPCETVLFYNLQDIITLRRFVDESGQQEINMDKLQRMQEYAESQVCRRRILLNYFGETSDHSCGNCDICQTPPSMFDGTIIVQKALSAIARTNENIGFTIVIDILRGVLSQDVVANNYQQIKTFGVGKDISVRDWHDYLLQMLQMGFFEIAYNEDRHLHITPLGHEVLIGNKTVQLAEINREDFSVRAQRRKEKERRQQAMAESKSSENIELFNRLNDIRKKVASQFSKPPYMIMPDRSLHELASYKPTTVKAFGDIFGIGEYKALLYSKYFIDVIKGYVTSPDKEPIPATVDSSKSQEGQTNYMEEQKLLHANAYSKWNEEEEKKLVEYYSQGKSVTEIAAILRRNEGGISSRIKKMGLISKEEVDPVAVPINKENEKWFGDYEVELGQLYEQKAIIEERIQNLRSIIIQQMETHNNESLASSKFTITYYPSRITMQFDSKKFKDENEELYSSYCIPKEKKASIVIKLNKKE